MLTRALIGGILAIIIALAARRARSLAHSGAIAAVVIGTAAAAAGWTWTILLIVYFASSTLLSRWERVEKERRTASVVAKGGERDAIQVLANGGVFMCAALAMITQPHVRWLAIGMGSLAASAADTWATEVGTLVGGMPRSIVSFRRLTPGVSGGVSLLGTVAALFGACVVAFLGGVLGVSLRTCVAVSAGGFGGAIVDSVLGATVQARRWCPSCERVTERGVHDCGTATEPRGGIAWLDNDAVNFASTAIGGLLSAWLAR